MAATLDQIARHLALHRDRYVDVLGEVKRIFESEIPKKHSDLANRYRVSSREDYQKDELKNPFSLWAKIKSREKEFGRSLNVSDIGDIIGIKVICTYSGVKDRVAKLIKLRNTWFSAVHPNRTDKQKRQAANLRRGYSGINFIIRLRSLHPDLKCEVQVLTLLEEAWSHATHDLIYKGEYAREEDVQQARLFSEALAVADAQSEAIRLKIECLRDNERRRKTAAQLFLMKRVAANANLANADIRELQDHVIKHQSSLRVGRVEKSLAKFQAYLEKHGADWHLCRLVTLLAVLRQADDLDRFASAIVDEFVAQESSKGDLRKAQAFRLRGVVNDCLDRVELAISDTEIALKAARRGKDNKLLAGCEANLGYYLAEDGHHDHRAKALGLIKLAKEHDSKSTSILDTEGFVEIVYGKDADAVRAGLAKCKTAAKKDEAASAFLPLHECKAYEQLLKML